MQQSGTFSYGLRQLSPSRWASVKVYGVEVALYKNFGVGFSAVAEPYFNFGYWGVVGFFLLAGAFFARMEASNLIFNYHWLVFSTLFYWLLLMTVRNEFGNFTKPASFMLICLGIWLLVRRFTPFARP
jgi:oligosaccharide repeat unit polymerase